MKRIIASLLAFVVAISTSVVTFADDKPTETFSLNEYDYIAFIEESSDGELKEKGIDPAEAQQIVAQYEKGLSERALMSEEQLYGLGYSMSDIQILRKYANGKALTEAEMRALSASCTGRITSSYMTDREVTFKYSWTWDQSPIVVATDAAGVQWVAYGNQTVIGMRKISDTCKIDYYYGNTLKMTGSGRKGSEVKDNALSYIFDAAKTTTSSTGDIVYAYAKKGYVEIELEVTPTIIPDMTYIAVGALYGHSTLDITEPTLNADSSGVSLSFSPTSTVDNIAPAKVHIEKGTTYSRPNVIDQM